VSTRFDEPGKQKVALLVLDGLALDQWLVLRGAGTTTSPVTVPFRSSIAWVPTITLVSRQAVFAGKPPLS